MTPICEPYSVHSAASYLAIQDAADAGRRVSDASHSGTYRVVLDAR